MKALNKMLIRDMIKSKGQYIAAASVIFAGIIMFVACFMSYKNLDVSMNKYYKDYNFLDYYAKAQNITPKDMERVKAIAGVKKVESRIVMDVSANMGESNRTTLRLISSIKDAPPLINKLYYKSGGYFKGEDKNQCLINKNFADYYKLKVGDSVNTAINSKDYNFKIVGIVESPEYIVAIKSAASPMPSAESFGIIYVREDKIKDILGEQVAYNEMHFLFNEEANPEVLKKEIESELKSTGLYFGTLRKNQLSSAMVESEIKELKSIALIFPGLFLLVAAMIIYTMEKRIINNQRTLIGVMKAMGYSSRKITGHYVLMAIFIALIGALSGVIGGFYLGGWMTKMYTEFFNIPIMDTRFYMEILFMGVLISLITCIFSAYNGVKRISKIQPAEAMRSEVPRVGRRIFLERFEGLWEKVPFRWKISIRNIFRNPQRTLLTMLGTVVTVMFFMVTLFFMDSMKYIVKEQFTKFQTYDYKISFNASMEEKRLSDIIALEGVKKVEPIGEMPCEIVNGSKKEETILMALTKNSSFYHLKNENKLAIDVTDDGVLIAETIAEKLSIKVGDEVTLKLYGSSKVESKIRVTGLVKQYTGFNCFISQKEFAKLLGRNKTVSGVVISIDKDKESDIRKKLSAISYIDNFESREKAQSNFNFAIAFMYEFITIMIVFGAVMGFAVIFNITIINIMERKRELTSMKVMGYKSREIESTIFRENMILGIFSLLPGVIVGRIMCEVLAKFFSTDLFSLEIYISPTTYIFSFISVVVFIILSQLANRKSIVRLDMVEVLKNKEG
jgi:putative ABC transport system permease protein